MLSPSHLPEPLTSLVGREPEIRRIERVLSDPATRHLTLTGPGGIGKTRLALRIAQSVGDDFPDGVTFVDLSSLTDPDLVPLAIANSVGLTSTEAVEEALIAHFVDLSALLILDNFEHLLPAAPVVPRLAAACPELVILVTSRERLGTSGEQVLPVDPLALPPQNGVPTVSQVIGSPAVRLFMERAAAVRPEFVLSDGNAAEISAICRRLDGLPLGIELAAARIAHLSPTEIVSHIGQLLPLLVGGPADAPTRLRSLHDAVRWSYELLTAEEQMLFCRLAVFAGGCTVGAAADVCVIRMWATETDDGSADVSTLLLLASLTDKSLLRATDRDGGEMRYTMLEPVREFALAELRARGEEAAVRRAHAEHLLAFADRIRTELGVHDTAAWIRRLGAEMDNFRAALQWLLETAPADDQTALELCNELAPFWLWRGQWSEAKAWLTRAVRQAGESVSEAVAEAYFNLGHVEVGSARDSFRYYERSLAISRQLGHQRGIINLLSSLGMTAEQMGEYASAQAYLEESLSRSEELADEYGVALALYHLGIVAGRMGEVERGKEYLDRARGLWEQLGDVAFVAFTIIELGRLYRLQRRLDEAADLLDWSVARLEQTGISHAQGPAHFELGEVALQRGDLQQADREFRRALRLLREANIIHTGFAGAVDGLARLVRRRRPDAAVEAFAAIEAWQQRTGFRATPGEEQRRRKALEACRRQLGASRFTVSWERGLRASLTGAADLLGALKVPLAEPTSPASRRPAAADVEVDQLTKQERRVLCALLEGLSNQQIADQLSITIRTAGNHVTNILGKLSVDNRTQAAAVAFRNNLCPPPG